MNKVRIFLISICIILFLLTIYFSPLQYFFNGERVEGRVVTLTQSMHPESGDMVTAPVVMYEVNGVEYKYVSNVATGSNSFSVGDRVEMLYMISDPSDARLNRFVDLWLLSVILAGVFLIAVIVTVLVLKSFRKSKKLNKQKRIIMERGVETDGIATFVDKNFRMLVNNKPIFSIIEYKFNDTTGREYIRTVDKVDSDLVIRLKIEVGGKVRVKYLQEDPTQSVILFN